MFERIAPLDPGRDQRFLDRGIAVVGLPEPVLAQTVRRCRRACRTRARERAVRSACRSRSVASLNALPAPLASAIGCATQAFVRPLRAADERADMLGNEAGDGSAALRAHADAIAAIESDLAPFIERFQLTRTARAPARCHCAAPHAGSNRRSRRERRLPMRALGGDAARANAVLLLAAAIDGRPQRRRSPAKRRCRPRHRRAARRAPAAPLRSPQRRR